MELSIQELYQMLGERDVQIRILQKRLAELEELLMEESESDSVEE